MPHRHVAGDRLARRQHIRGNRADDLASRGSQIHVDAQMVRWTVEFELERRLKLDPYERRHQARDLRQRRLVGRDLNLEDRLGQVVFHRAVDRQRRLLRPHRQLVDEHRVVSNRHAARQRVQTDRRLRAAERDVGDLDAVADRRVFEIELRVEMLEPLRHLDAGRADRVGNLDGAVADPDVGNRNRAGGALTVRLLPLSFDEAADRPGVAVAPQVDHRLVQPDVVDREALRDQFEHAVVEPEVLDGHDLRAVHRHADVLELDAVEQVPAKPADRHLPVQVLIRFALDVDAEPVLEPRRLRHDDDRPRGADDERHDNDQRMEESSAHSEFLNS